MIYSINSLKEYCKANQRICPMPSSWNDLFNMLKNKTNNEPALPLILSAWYDTGAMFKQIVFFEHLDWANKQGQIEQVSTFLKELPENEWFHIYD